MSTKMYAIEFDDASRGIGLLGIHYNKASSSLNKGRIAIEEMEAELTKLERIRAIDEKALDDFINYQNDKSFLQDFLMGLSTNILSVLIFGILAITGVSGYVAGKLTRTKRQISG